MLAEVIAIGDELTTGQRLDTNSQWLSEQLTRLGLRVMYHTTVADDLDANVQVLRTAWERADVVIATGGLGPTADDLTREAIAAALDVELVLDESALAHVLQLFADRGRAMPERNRLQAYLPRGSRQILNPHGTAPGVAVDVERTGRQPSRLFALPGVPAEMKTMWEASVAPALVDSQPQQRVTRHRRIKCFGAGESQIEAMLPDLIRRGRQPLVGITASGATITLRVTADGHDEASCLQTMEPTVRQIQDALGMLVYGEGDDELQHAVVELLARRGATVATAEWSSTALLAQWLAEVPQADGCYAGGLVIPDLRAMAALLDGAEPSTEQIARRVRDQADADFGLAVGKTDVSEDDVEYVSVALATRTEVSSKRLKPFGDPGLTKLRAAKVALNELRLHLLRSDLP